MSPLMIGQTTDRNLIRALVGHPDIYPTSRDDYTPSPGDLEPVTGEGMFWLVPRVGDDLIGIVLFHQQNGICFEFHIGILRAFRGPIGYRSGALAIAWMRAHTPARKLMCWVETEARHVYAYVTALGFGREGLAYGSVQRNGVLRDRYLMGQSLCQ